MTDTFKYSTDTDFKSRIEYFEEEHPYQELDGLTDDQIEGLLREAGIGQDFDPDEDIPLDLTEPDIAEEKTNNLTTSEMRSILIANGIVVGSRGRLSPAQIAKAVELS